MLTAKEISAVESYTGPSYALINGCLRFEEPISDATRAAINGLDTAIAKSVTSRDIVVYRGVDETYARTLEARDLATGDFLQDAGFLSTSLDENVARRFLGSAGGGMLIKIKVRAGSKALDVSPYSKNPDEKEFLLSRDAELRVVGYDADSDVLELEVI